MDAIKYRHVSTGVIKTSAEWIEDYTHEHLKCEDPMSFFIELLQGGTFELVIETIDSSDEVA